MRILCLRICNPLNYSPLKHVVHIAYRFSLGNNVQKAIVLHAAGSSFHQSSESS